MPGPSRLPPVTSFTQPAVSATEENQNAESATQATATQSTDTSTFAAAWCGTPNWPGREPSFAMPVNPLPVPPGLGLQIGFPPVYGRPVPPQNGAPVYVPVPVPVPACPAYPPYQQATCIVSSIGHYEFEREAHRMEDDGWSYMGKTDISRFKTQLLFERNPYVRNVVVGFSPFDVERKQRKMAHEGWAFEGQRAEGSFNQVLTFRLVGHQPSFF